MVKILALVEGHTEERFIKKILSPHYFKLSLFIVPAIYATKVVKNGPNFKGGGLSFIKFKDQIKRLLKDSSASAVTTMIDYYACPADFPGRDRKMQGDNQKSVELFERAVAAEIDDRKFIPFFTLHDFEGLLFSSPKDIADHMDGVEKFLLDIRDKFNTPEDINDSPKTCPSNRIVSLFPEYRKPLDGVLIAQKIGLPKMRQQCPHFDQWLQKLEKLASTP